MASPENTNSAPKSSPVQDSPIYQYVSSLSPIKPVNARSGVQAYDNVDVPSPQLVFKTPNFSRQRNLDLLERSRHMAATGSETLSPAYAGNNMSFSVSMDVRGPYVSVPMSQLISCNLKGRGNAEPSPEQPTISPSSWVDAYLADPVETDDHLSSSPDFCVKRAVKDIQVYRTITDENKMKCFKEDPAADHPQSPSLPVKELVDDSRNSSTPAVLHVLQLKQDADLPHTQNDSTGNKESTLALQAINAKKDASSIGVESLDAPQNEEHLGEVPITGVSLTTSQDNLRNLPLSEEVFNIGGLSTGEKLGSLSKNATINTESPLLPSASTQQHNVVNQYAVDNLVVSVSKDCDMGSHAKENITICSFSQELQDLNLLANKAIRSDTLDCNPQLHPDPPHNIQEGGSHVDNLRLTISVSTGKQILYNQEDGVQYQRGKRKRLQFESVENLMMSTGCNSNSCSLTLEDSIVESPITPLVTETVNTSHAESITVSNSTPVIKPIPGNFFCRLSVDVDIKGGYQGTTQGTAPRPSGIGLHLNSIGGSGPTISNSNMQMPTRDASVQGKCFVEHNDQVSQKMNACLAPMSSLGPPVTLSSSSEHPSSYAGTENYGEKHKGDQAIIVSNSSVNYHSPMFVKPLNQSLPSKLTDLCMTPCTMKRLSSEDVSRSGDSTQSSPRKKWKKASENEVHKRCNCKRSKCLKLYCDCFAAGSFCTEACACQGCFNKSEHEDTVQETRQQIESRNPLAFAPKVVVRVVDLPKDSGDSKPITPTSARHKRGCNCKKSMCLKRYCECYQAGVGCSLGCRCEGCKNSFGTRDGCGGISEMVVEHKRPKETSWERNLSGELESIEVKRDLANTKPSHSGLSPITPSIQTSFGSHAPKHQFPVSYYPSPDSGVSVIPSNESFGAASDSIQSGAFAKEREGSSNLVPYVPDFEYHNAGDLNSFSPGWDGFPEICNLSPLLKTPSAGGSSASKTRERKLLQTTLFHGSVRVSTEYCHSSPVTPLPRFGGSKFIRETDSDNGLHGNPEDDTPEILKDTQPIKTVKATSPNQKRVSPPHQIVSEARSSSPSAIRSGRKFILQSVPAFPSLTPYCNNTRPEGA